MSRLIINLDTINKNSSKLKCKQNDDRILTVRLFDRGQPLDITNSILTLNAVKPSNTFVIQSSNITKVSINEADIQLNRDIVREGGEVKLELVIAKNLKQITTFSFILEVEKSILAGAVASKNTVTILEELQTNCNLADVKKEELKKAISDGNITTMRSDITKNTNDITNITNIKQNKIDDRLKTQSKEVVPAINELLNSINTNATITIPSFGEINIVDKWKHKTSIYPINLVNALNYNTNTYGELRAEVNGYEVMITGVVNLTTLTPTPNSGGDLCIASIRPELLPLFSIVGLTNGFSEDFTQSKTTSCMVDYRPTSGALNQLRVTTSNTTYKTYYSLNLQYKIPYNFLHSYYNSFYTNYNIVNDRVNMSRPILIGTDTHFGYFKGKDDIATIQSYSINNAIENMNCPFGILMGDILDDHINYTKPEMIDKITGIRRVLKDNVLYAKGNHDINFITNANTNIIDRLSSKELWNSFMDGKTCIKHDNSKDFYYFVDDEISKIRHIVVNVLDSDSTWVIRQNQLKWLTDVALNIPKDYAVCLYSHHSFIKDVYPSDNIINSDILLQILKAFKTGINGTFTGTNSTYPCSITTNFTKINDVIACFFGHMHEDSNRKVDNINHIGLNSVLHESRGTTGVITQCFDVLQVDKNNKVLYLTRFGAGSNRQFNY